MKPSSTNWTLATEDPSHGTVYEPHIKLLGSTVDAITHVDKINKAHI